MRILSKSIALAVVGILISLNISSAAFSGSIKIEDSASGFKTIQSKILNNSNIFQKIEDAEDKLAEYKTDEIIVKFKNKASFERISLPAGLSVSKALTNYQGRNDVEYAEPNYIARTFYTPNDTYYSLQWGFDNNSNSGINTEEAWNTSKGQGVVVAVVDTGVAYENYGFWYQKAPDFNNTCFVPGYDFANNDTHPNDDNGHGTHVAGTIAESTNNNLGAAGIAFESCIMPVKVLNRQGSGSYADIADGIRWAADNGADIINLSLGGPSSASYLENAVAYAHGKGVTIVAAAGNDGQNSISYPAAYNDYVIAVGATRFDKKLAPYSNRGAGLDLVAPGGDLSVDQNGDGYGDGILQQTFGSNPRDFGYWFFQGTSMASPHVAAAAALLISHGNATTPTDVQTALQETAADLGSTGWDSTYGFGLVNAAAALNWSSGTTPPPPPPVNNPPVANAGSDQTAEVGSTLSFDGGSSTDDGLITSYAWTFGDGGSANGVNVSHTYNSTGTFTITLTVTDNGGLTDSDTASVQITAVPENNPPPPPPSSNPQQIFFDDFQSGFGQWVESNEFDWNIERPRERSVPGSSSGNLVAHADDCDSYCVITLANPINLSGYGSATLNFDRFVDNAIDTGEYLRVEAFNGNTWNTLFYWTARSGDDNEWHTEVFDLSSYLTPNFSLRFTAKASSASEELEIDNVLIKTN